MTVKIKKKTPKLLTGIRLDQGLKEAALIVAQRQNRSFSNYLENLVRKDVVAEGVYPPM